MPGYRDDYDLCVFDTDFEFEPVRDFSDLISRSFRLYGGTFGPILLVSLLLLAPLDAVQTFVESGLLGPEWALLGAVVGLIRTLVQIWLTPAVIFAMAKVLRDGKAPSLGEMLGWGGRRLGPALGYGLLTGIAVVGGMLLLIVPGLYLACLYAAVMLIIALEGREGPRKVLERSRLATRGRRWSYLVATLILGLLMVGIAILGGAAMAGVMLASTGPGGLGQSGTWAGALGEIVLAVVITVYVWVMQGPGLLIYLSAMAEWRRCCPGCGYDLTGNTSGACPECGADVGDRGARALVPARAATTAGRD